MNTAPPEFSGRLKALYVIHGEEDLLRIEALDALRAAARQQGYLNRESHTPEKQEDWDALAASAGSIGLFADLKLLEIHLPGGKPGKAGGDALAAFAARLPEDTVSVVVLPKLDGTQLKSKWFTALAAAGSVIEAKAVTPQQLPHWIENRLSRHRLNIEADALALFAQRVEGNLPAARQETDKLALLHPPGHTVTLEDAENAVADVARFDIFQLSACWMTGDTGRTLRLLDNLEQSGAEPVLLLWSLAEDIRTLIRLSAALKQGQSLQSLRGSLRLWGDRQQHAAAAAKRLNAARLMAALQECARIDRIIKGAEEGNTWAALTQLAGGLSRPS